jgi:hypothetical protein
MAASPLLVTGLPALFTHGLPMLLAYLWLWILFVLSVRLISRMLQSKASAAMRVLWFVLETKILFTMLSVFILQASVVYGILFYDQSNSSGYLHAMDIDFAAREFTPFWRCMKTKFLQEISTFTNTMALF